MKVLVSNVGSTSFKYQLFDMTDEAVLAKGKIERVGSPKSFLTHLPTGKESLKSEVDSPDHNASIKIALDMLLDSKYGVIKDLSEISAVGFKTVHAGKISGSVLITEEVMKAMEEFTDLVPLHNPPYMNAIRVFQKTTPGIPLVGVFETAFHQELPPYAYTYSIPYEWYEKHGIKRCGFHGASHRYISEVTPEILGKPKEELRIISCHMGGSSSLCAIKGGKSVDTSMGFSAQTGVPMATRNGDIDPFIIPFIMDKEGLTTDEVRNILVRESGLAGISGVGGDMRDIQEAAAEGNERAALALDVFCYEVKKYIGAYTVAMGGVDAIVFTAGIGENETAVRAKICDGLEAIGAKLDPAKNTRPVKGYFISTDDSKVKLMVVPTNEEIIVARETVKVVNQIKGS